MKDLPLTAGQQNALDSCVRFLTDPLETVFVLRGYSGTGKSTLVTRLVDQLPSIMKTIRLLNPQAFDYQLELTATTNKAAENFSLITGLPVATIHSYLGLRVQTDYKTNVTKLIPTAKDQKYGILLLIDEASYIDAALLKLIFQSIRNCKIVFIGDPAQLIQFNATNAPVFCAKFPGAELTEVVRQITKENEPLHPITELAAKFRETVTTGEFFSFKPDGHHIQHMSRPDFGKAVEAEFNRPNWRYQDSKILAWTNARVIAFNHAVRDMAKGDPDFQVGDYAVCNKYVQIGSQSIKTDQLVCITEIGEDTEVLGVMGNKITLDNRISAFFPKSREEKNAFIRLARANEQYMAVKEAESEWIDLRAAYACTVNKAQGSTYDKVFIDLDDIARCNSGNQIARMMYVAVSRARHQVIFTGDFA